MAKFRVCNECYEKHGRPSASGKNRFLPSIKEALDKSEPPPPLGRPVLFEGGAHSIETNYSQDVVERLARMAAIRKVNRCAIIRKAVNLYLNHLEDVTPGARRDPEDEEL